MRTAKGQRLRCVNCRTRRTDAHLMFLHEQKCRQQDCICGGYHFKHRFGSKYCVGNPKSDLYHAVRRGEAADVLADIMLDILFTHRPREAMAAECPF